jgi:Double-GTPase 2
MVAGCKNDNCTVAATGVCLLNNDPATCVQRLAVESPISDMTAELADVPPAAQNPTFPPSFTLSLDDITSMMSGAYCRIIGILGPPDAGKTAALVCLYLLTSVNRLVGFAFRDSKTLLALEEISRGARRWRQGDLPGKLTAHTEQPDERAAGFLHIRLARSDESEAYDLLIPDLPGEWTTSLIDYNRTDRLDFLRSADVIWLMVDGQELADRATRHTATHRTSVLLQRLKAFIGGCMPTVHLVISRLDKGEIATAAYKAILQEAELLQVPLSVFQIASFSELEEVRPGNGMPELISAALAPASSAGRCWPDREVSPESRHMLKYRVRI